MQTWPQSKRRGNQWAKKAVLLDSGKARSELAQN
jgi:hypothetical protein